MTTNIINELYSHLAQFSDTDRKIADYILTDPSVVVDMTIAALARAAGVSEASVSRFCRTINVGGFHQLKIALAQVAGDKANYYQPLSDDDVQQSLQHIAANKQAEIQNTLNIPTATIEAILSAIQEASVIQITAAGGTQPVAIDAVYKFNQLGLLAFGGENSDTAIAQILNLPSTGLLIVISNSGETLSLINQVKVAKRRGVAVLALTNRSDSPIATLADWHIQTAVRQQVFAAEYYFSRIASMTAIEALFLLLLARDPRYRDHIKAHEALIADAKL